MYEWNLFVLLQGGCYIFISSFLHFISYTYIYSHIEFLISILYCYEEKLILKYDLVTKHLFQIRWSDAQFFSYYMYDIIDLFSRCMSELILCDLSWFLKLPAPALKGN